MGKMVFKIQILLKYFNLQLIIILIESMRLNRFKFDFAFFMILILILKVFFVNSTGYTST